MSSCAKFVFRISALTFTCWLDNVLRSKRRFITWLLPMIHNEYNPLSPQYLFPLCFPSLLPLFHVISIIFSLVSLYGFASLFLLSSFVFGCIPSLPICLSTLSSWLSSPSVFLLFCPCASFMGRNSQSHMGEDQLHRESEGPFLEKFEFYQHVPLNLPRPHWPRKSDYEN